MMIRSRDTPINVAVIGSCATARMPRPNFVRLIARSVSSAKISAADDDDQRDVGDVGTEDGELRLRLHQDDRLLRVAAAVALESVRQDEVDELLHHERTADRGDQEGQRAGIAPAQGR